MLGVGVGVGLGVGLVGLGGSCLDWIGLDWDGIGIGLGWDGMGWDVRRVGVSF